MLLCFITLTSQPHSVSVVGYPEDKLASGEEIREVLKLLNSFNITCCMVDVAALDYYGSHRVLHVSVDLFILESIYVNNPLGLRSLRTIGKI